MPQIQVKNLNQGGIADSDYIGAEGSVSEMVNLDIHSEAGLIKCNQALVKDSGTTVIDFVQARVACSNGSTYMFGDAGKIYERQTDGTWTVRGTAAPAVGDVGILSAEEDRGFIYFATESRIGRFAVPAAGAAITIANDWATFDITDAVFHPMKKVNLVLYIGDGNQVAQIDNGVFSSNALDIAAPLRVSSLGILDTDLLIGTFISNNVLQTQIIRWNTWSKSFSVSDPIPEMGINAFLESDNIVVVNAGVKGNLYIYDGAQLDTYQKVKGDYSATNKAKVRDNAVFNFNGMPLFGLSLVTGTGVNLGVYSMARTNRKYPYVLNLEFAISTGNLTKIEIGAIVPVSADQFLVSWKDTTTGTVYGVDIMSLTEKATGYFVTRLMNVDREVETNYGEAHVPHRALASGTDINIYHDKNHTGSFTQMSTKKDSKRKTVLTEKGIGDAAILKTKVEMTPNANDAPEVEQLIITLSEGQ